MRLLPILETPRLTLRPFTTDDAVAGWRIADLCFGDGTRAADPDAIAAFRQTIERINHSQLRLAELYQPPYGDRAVVLKTSGQVIGQVGYVPCVDQYARIPALAPHNQPNTHAQSEVGLFWSIDPDFQGRGFATEAARALIDYAFDPAGVWSGLARMIATTEFDNAASQAVMRKLGMQLERNETGAPPWLQVVGVLNA
jgi:[ribosomal protein S5]-alanine N-acetyltransferase